MTTFDEQRDIEAEGQRAAIYHSRRSDRSYGASEAEINGAMRNIDRLEAALIDIIQADDAFRASMAPGVERDPVTQACDRARALLSIRGLTVGTGSPERLAASPERGADKP